MSDVKQIDLETGDEIIRPFTADEISQAEYDAQAAAIAYEALDAALTKLTKLGLTKGDLEALGLV